MQYSLAGTDLESRLWEEILRLANKLEQDAKRFDGNLCWRMPQAGVGIKGTVEYSPALYNGSAGIALFFLELFSHSGIVRHREVAESAIRWVLTTMDHAPTTNYAFITGRMGIAYVLGRFFQVTGQASYLKEALRMCVGVRSFLGSTNVQDYLNGHAGTLFALTFIHHLSREQWLLEEIELFLSNMVNGLHFGDRGLYCDRSENNNYGLCGFSHGASGIAFVMAELANYFQNPALILLAGEALRYENSWFNAKMQNWPDFRETIWTDKELLAFEEIYRKGNHQFFSNKKAEDFNAWCHGAAGIGMVRLRVSEYFPNLSVQKAINNSLLKTEKTNLGSPETYLTHCLCHGEAGNGELFLEAARTLQNPNLLDKACQIAEKCLLVPNSEKPYSLGSSHFFTPDNNGLFTGSSGIAYFYLQLACFPFVPSILAPRLPKTEGALSPIKFLSKTQIKKCLANKIYSRTISVLESVAPDETVAYFETQPCEQLLVGLQPLALGLQRRLSQNDKSRLEEGILYDSTLFALDNAHASNSLLRIKKICEVKDGQQIRSYDHIRDKTLQISSRYCILATKWNWSSTGSEMHRAEKTSGDNQNHYCLLQATPSGVQEITISKFIFVILQFFTTPKKVEAAETEFIREIVDNSDSESIQIKKYWKSQLITLLEQGCLTAC